MGEEKNTTERGMASDIFDMLKKVILVQWIIIGILILIIAAQSFYHDYKWSEFDTIVVDGGESGYANYIGNDGDINYGEDSGSKEEKQEGQQQTKENEDKD